MPELRKHWLLCRAKDWVDETDSTIAPANFMRCSSGERSARVQGTVQHGSRLAFAMDFRDLLQPLRMLLHRAPDGVAFERDHVLGFACGRGHCLVPQAPVALIHYIVQVETKLLQSAHVVS